MSLDLLLYIIAAILFGLRAYGVPSGRWHLGWLGMVVFMLTFIF